MFSKFKKTVIIFEMASTENPLIFRYKNTDILKNVHISNLLSVFTEFKFDIRSIKIQHLPQEQTTLP